MVMGQLAANSALYTLVAKNGAAWEPADDNNLPDLVDLKFEYEAEVSENTDDEDGVDDSCLDNDSDSDSDDQSDSGAVEDTGKNSVAFMFKVNAKLEQQYLLIKP